MVFGEILWRTLSGLIPHVELPSDRAWSSKRPIVIPSENLPCRGSERTTRVHPPPETEGLQFGGVGVFSIEIAIRGPKSTDPKAKIK